MNRRTSLSALVGLSVLLTSLAASANPLVPVHVIYELEVEEGTTLCIDNPFCKKMDLFLTEQKTVWGKFEAKPDLTQKVVFTFGRDHILWSGSPMKCSAKELFDRRKGALASRARQLFVTDLTRKSLPPLDLNGNYKEQSKKWVERLNTWRKFVNYAQMSVYLQVPADQVAGFLAKVPEARRV